MRQVQREIREGLAAEMEESIERQDFKNARIVERELMRACLGDIARDFGDPVEIAEFALDYAYLQYPRMCQCDREGIE